MQTNQSEGTNLGGDRSQGAQSQRPLRGLLIAQFFGAFNDNAWKLLVALLAIQSIPKDAADYETLSQMRTTMTFVIFTLPLMLFSLPAGTFADRISKRWIIVAMKGVEIVLMACGTLVLFLVPGSTVLPLVVLGLMGVQSALFSPAKFGILPELLSHKQLSKGNALLEMWTFLAIILGTAAGGALLDATRGHLWLSGVILTVLAVTGFIAALGVPHVPPSRPEGGSISEIVRSAWGAIRADRALWLAILGSAYFWGTASLLGQDILVYTKNLTKEMANSDTLSGLPMAAFGIGIGIGSMLAARLSSSKVETGLIPLGTLGLALLTMILGLTGPGLAGTLILMGLLGIASGLITVPLLSLIQWRAPADRRGAVIALSNVLVFASVLCGSLAATGMALAGLSPQGILIVASVVTVICTVWALQLLPEALFRLVMVLITRSLYRVKSTNREVIPETGGALLVPNHVSFVDGLLISTATDRPIRFVVHSHYYNQPLLRPIMTLIGAIPIASTGSPREILQGLRLAGQALDEGELVCIFAEGQITRTGTLSPFRRGLERIAKGRDVPILPIYLDQLWGSVFSNEGGKFFFKMPKRIPYPVGIYFGDPLPSATPIFQVQEAVRSLGQVAWEARKPERPPLHHTFIRVARRNPLQLAFVDATSPATSRIKSLVGSIALARKLKPEWQNQETVGIFLPPSVPGALINLAAALAGRTSVNLNYTVGRAGLESAAQQSKLETVVTSRKFLEKAKLELPENVRPIWIEDVAKTITGGDKAFALLLACFAPARMIERLCGATQPVTPDDIATIIFSSGSTGEPKGVVLSHFNIDSNVESAAQVVPLRDGDRILGILPFFHSFGYTATLWLAVNHKLGVVYHVNPLDAPVIGGLVERHHVTLMIATPTFLRMYYRRCEPAQFGALRFLITGAEKLPQQLADAFEERFGIRPLEGYGVTECSPIISICLPDFRAPSLYQPGYRKGSVGRPLPGVMTRIADPETGEVLPPNTPGMLLIKGPNVMQGYLNRDDLTAEVMHEGWYATGDIAQLDLEGFITITDRLSRFSKIGGEMVPHGRIEEAFQAAVDQEEKVFAITAVEDEQKGERLAVLHTLPEEAIPGILETVAASGLPNLFIPRRDSFVKVEQVPILGSGKLDLRAIKQIARERLLGK